MSAGNLHRSRENLGRALDRLDEALAQREDRNALVIDGTIQRFEFAIELCWKLFKRQLATEGVETATPKDTLRAAFQAGWLDNETAWLDMLADRNRTSHIYDEQMARAIYGRIRGYAPVMRAAFAKVSDRPG